MSTEREPPSAARGAFVTLPAHPWDEVPDIPSDRVTITVHPPSLTKRPIGYAPWPKVKKRKKGKK